MLITWNKKRVVEYILTINITSRNRKARVVHNKRDAISQDMEI